MKKIRKEEADSVGHQKYAKMQAYQKSMVTQNGDVYKEKG